LAPVVDRLSIHGMDSGHSSQDSLT
jgi:hypothetical protein